MNKSEKPALTGNNDSRSASSSDQPEQDEGDSCKSPVAAEIERFVNQVHSLGSSMPIVMLMLNAAFKVAREEYERFTAMIYRVGSTRLDVSAVAGHPRAACALKV